MREVETLARLILPDVARDVGGQPRGAAAGSGFYDLGADKAAGH
jgi:hypothetical protein